MTLNIIRTDVSSGGPDLRPHPALRIPLYLIACLVSLNLAGIVLGLAGPADPTAAALLGVTFATWLAVRHLDGERLADLGLAWRPAVLPDFLLGLCLPAVLLAAVFALEWSAGWLLPAGIRPGGWTSAAGMLWRFGAVAWYEEIFFRGYLLRNLERLTGLFRANLLTAVVFAGLHALNPHATPMALLGVALAGLFLGFTRQATRLLHLPLAFHFSWNLSQGLLGYPVSGVGEFGLLRLVRDGPALLTGGPFGPEAGLLGFAAILVAMGVVRHYTKRRVKTET